MTALSIKSALIAIFFSAVVILLTRVMPFILFSRRNPPKIINFIEKYVPQMIIAVLVVYCFKDLQFTSAPFGLPFIVSCVLTVVLHLTTKNSMISILGSTVFYMIMSRLF